MNNFKQFGHARKKMHFYFTAIFTGGYSALVTETIEIAKIR